jgi:TonB-dependent receptor
MRIRVMALVSTALGLLATCEAQAQSVPDQGAESKAGDIVVTAPRKEAEAREVQQRAPNIVNVQSAETIAKYPDFNAAEALSRIPGISLSSDTGEGRFVNIRGIDGNLNGATYGGVVLLNTNPGGTVFGSGRAVEFDTIPTGAIDGIVVTKTGMPNHDAEGLGGTIELTPRSAAHINSPFVEGALGYGYEPDHGHGGPLNVDIAVGARFGYGDGGLLVQHKHSAYVERDGWISNPTPFSIVLTASRRDDRRGFDDLEEDYHDAEDLIPQSGPPLTAQQIDKALTDIQLRRYDYHRRRYGYGGEFAFTPNDDHSFYLRGSVAGYVESVIKNRLTYDDLDTINDDGTTTVVNDPAKTGKGYITQSDLSLVGTDEEERHRNEVFVVGGKDHFGAFTIDYHAAYSRATFDVDRNYGTKFKGPQGVAFAYDNNTDDNFPSLNVLDGTDVNDPSGYTLKSLSNSQEHDIDHEWSYAANGTLALHLIGDNDSLQFGGEVRLRTKVANPFTEDFDVSKVSLSDLSNGAHTDFYGGLYTNGPQISASGVRGLISNGTAVSQGLVLDPSGYFLAKENIYAGYIMYTASRGPLSGVAGVRVEATRAHYSSYSVDPDDNPLSYDTRKANYTNLFPTVQLRYEIRPQFIARATWSTGIGRPGFSQIAAATTIDRDNGIITTGNPDLKPTTGNNFDLSLEYYLPHAGILSLGLFDKEFDNYIVQRTRIGTDSRLPDFSAVRFDTYENVPSAHARGVEAAYSQRFSWLPAPFDGLGLDANVTLVDSQVELRTGEKRLLPATSKLTYNVAGSYEAHGIQLRLSLDHVSHSLFGIGDSPASDVYQDNRTTLDLTTSYELFENVHVYFNVKNLTNARLRYYEGSPDRPIQREFYDQTYEAGVKVKF